MANTFSQTGQILQVDGENSGTWGDYTNTNWDINASLLGGNSAVSIASTNVNITSVDGMDDQGKNRIFLCTGVLTGNSTLTFPLKEREYVIINHCTGAFTLTVLPSGGTGIVIPQSVGGLMVYCDGTNMLQSIDLTALGGITSNNVNLFTSQQNFSAATLSYATPVTWNLNTAQVASVTFPAAGSTTLQNPTNMVSGGTYILFVRQPASGSGLLAYDTNYNFGLQGLPTLSIGNGLLDILTFISDGSSMYFVGIAPGF